MRVHAAEPAPREGEPQRREPEHVPGASALSPAIVSHMQAGAGNAAVARMLRPAGATLSREIDFAALAGRVHEAVDGLGTDEDAVYAALGELNHDPDATAQLSRGTSPRTERPSRRRSATTSAATSSPARSGCSGARTARHPPPDRSRRRR